MRRRINAVALGEYHFPTQFPAAMVIRIIFMRVFFSIVVQ
jgi:hypothetical protein